MSLLFFWSCDGIQIFSIDNTWLDPSLSQKFIQTWLAIPTASLIVVNQLTFQSCQFVTMACRDDLWLVCCSSIACPNGFPSCHGKNIPTPSQVGIWIKTSWDVLHPVGEVSCIPEKRGYYGSRTVIVRILTSVRRDFLVFNLLGFLLNFASGLLWQRSSHPIVW